MKGLVSQIPKVSPSPALKPSPCPTTPWPWPSTYRIPSRPNPVERTFMALPQVFHQIHCLDIFRKLANPAYYGEFWTGLEHFPFEQHVAHCQYLLLQTLMCHADLERVTFNKVNDMVGPFPDFSVEQKCRNFEDILEWKERHQVNVTEEEWRLILETPEGIRELEAEGRIVPAV